ncbi:MAG TPA: helix-turn-helix domain-containing protein [Gemmatimonadaceae bacterium]|nr:helix-turn-helix domain-containing protein [Gemmatimonadaceae bacterium]
MSELLTSADVAELLGVAQATVKRWADAGVLPCEKTAGHHRRFRREDVDRFRERQAIDAPAAARGWIELLVSGADVHAVHGRLLSDRARFGSWHAVATELSPVIAELGARWRAGQITILEEHLASSALARALARCAEAMPAHPGGPRVLLAAAEEEEHTLGLALVEVVAREAGASTLWAGEPTPTRELVAALDAGVADVLAVSASVGRDPKKLAGEAKRLVAAARNAGARVVFGGAGAWPRVPPPHVRLQDFRELHDWLVALPPRER